MSRKKLIVFPTEDQVKYICSIVSDYEFYILMHSSVNVSMLPKDNRVILLCGGSSEELIENIGVDVDVLCCHEEGLYWLKKFGHIGWNYQFSTEIFELLTKNKFKDYLLKHSIPNADYCEKISDIKSYPIIIKPIIGFGSIGVKKINNLSELKNYLNEYYKDVINSKIKPYKDKYFDINDNSFILENYISGCFYRTPFVVLENEVKYIFPIIGKETTYKKNSDFHWTDFEYGADEREIAVKLQPILNKLSLLFKLKSGVYVAEFILSDQGEVYLLELSPRQTSNRIARLVKLAAGLDMEKLAVDIFLSDVDNKSLANRNIRMRIERNSDRLDESIYSVIDSIEETSVYGDIIQTIYYEKRISNE